MYYVIYETSCRKEILHLCGLVIILLFHSKIVYDSMYHTAHARIEIKNYYNFMQTIANTKGIPLVSII